MREFEIINGGKKERKPLMQFTLEKLFESELVDEIVIVGHRMLIEQHLGNFINEFEKPCRIVNQNSKIPPDVIECFNIINRKVRFNSVAGNIIKGYAASTAYKYKKHTLFVVSDSPLTTKEFIERFVHIAQKSQDQAGIILPVVLMNENKDKLDRKPLKLRNDTAYQLSGIKDNHGRQGFRLSSLMFVNPHLCDMNTINTAYSLRKWLSPNVQMKLFKITHNLGYPNVYSKYFLRKDLSIKEMENIGSAFFKGRLKLIPTFGEESTYDYDGTEFEYRSIANMIKPT
ncbi:MAG TPA: hypothetical protein ENI07_11390 [Desulfobacterales bacterium]|nr:hypothetical protein [Desulfobacterales bacterium]